MVNQRYQQGAPLSQPILSSCKKGAKICSIEVIFVGVYWLGGGTGEPSGMLEIF